MHRYICTDLIQSVSFQSSPSWTHLNPQHTTDMGLLGSSNPAKKALKDLARTEKDEHRAQKVRHAAL